MDELAYALNLDPVQLRIRNHADMNPQVNKPWSSKNLLECYRLGRGKVRLEQAQPQTARHGVRGWLAGRLRHGDRNLSRLSVWRVGAGARCSWTGMRLFPAPRRTWERGRTR